jgi:D-arabinose 1-dehydrogenase-like Zn-dependent alcohol dehydrogenase
VPPCDERPVFLYFHGNGGSLRWREVRFHDLIADGSGLVALSYRGYGGSSGVPTEKGLVEDARAAYAFSVAHYPSERLVLWGESLGSAVAITLAAALQFAKMCGARVIATSSSDAKIERLRVLGADFTLNYKSTPNWGKKAREISGRGVDLVAEVGGVGTLNESIRATKVGGTIAFIGVLAGAPPAESRISLIVMQQQRLQGVTVGSVEDLQAMVNAIATNRMKPVIDRTFPFDEVKQAFSYMASGAHFGKVAISIS